MTGLTISSYVTEQGIQKGEVHCTIDLLFDWSVLQIKTKIVRCHTADSKPVKLEVNGTVILPPVVFPALRQPSHEVFVVSNLRNN